MLKTIRKMLDKLFQKKEWFLKSTYDHHHHKYIFCQCIKTSKQHKKNGISNLSDVN